MPAFVKFVERYQQHRASDRDVVLARTLQVQEEREWARTQLEDVVLPTIRHAKESLAGAAIVMVLRNWTERDVPQVRIAVSGIDSTTHFLDFIGRGRALTTVHGKLDSGGRDGGALGMDCLCDAAPSTEWVSAQMVAFLEVALLR